MLLRALVGETTFRVECFHDRLDFRQLPDEDRVVTDQENRLLVQVRHVLAEHLSITHVVIALDLFTHERDVFLCCCHAYFHS